eukprot:m.242335 g.242335  ORF g.242335 m.242335 type:complete len:51 (+) comp17455_c1_seq12:115-267(+)
MTELRRALLTVSWIGNGGVEFDFAACLTNSCDLQLSQAFCMQAIIKWLPE